MPQTISNCKLWIDGVGCQLLCIRDTVSLGNVMPTTKSAGKIGIVADLATKHIEIEQLDGSYWLTPHHETKLDDMVIHERSSLCHGTKITLGEDVHLRYTTPSTLSVSAILTMESGHRFDGGIDGVVLFQKTCLIGDGTQQHVRCDDWKEKIIIFERENELFCKSTANEFTVNNVPAGQISKVSDGAHFQGDDWSMRFEFIPEN